MRRAPWLYAGTTAAACVIAYVAAQILVDLVGDPYRTGILFHLFLSFERPAALVALTILALGWWLARRPGAGVARIVEFLTRHPRRVAALAALLLMAGCLAIYRDHPLSMDEYMARFQAEIFAAGKISGFYPPQLMHLLVPPPFADGHFMPFSLQTGRVLSAYWPGFSLLLAPFTKAHVPWLLNPVLAGGCLWLIWHLAGRLFPGSKAPGWALLLALASPVFAITGMSYYSMTAHLFLNLLFAALLFGPTSQLEARPRRLWLAGCAGSLALVLHNPVPHVLFAAPWLLFMAWKRRWRQLMIVAAGYLPVTLVLGVGWALIKGELAAERLAALGRGGGSSLGDVQAFLQLLGLPGLADLRLCAFGLLKMMVWAVPGLPVLAVLGYGLARADVRVRLLGASAVVTLAFHVFASCDHGHGWGYRYFFSAWGVLPVLAAGLLVQPIPAGPRLRRLVGAVALLSLTCGMALRLAQVGGFIERHLAQLPDAAVDMDAGALRVRFLDLSHGYYVEDLVQNDPFFRGPVWTLVSAGREQDAGLARQLFPNARLVAETDGGTAWVVDDPQPASE